VIKKDGGGGETFLKSLWLMSCISSFLASMYPKWSLKILPVDSV